MTDRKFAHLNIHFPLLRDATEARWQECLDTLERRVDRYVKNGVSVLWTTDHNKHGGFPRVGRGKVIGGAGLDLIGFVPAKGGAQAAVLDQKIVDLTIDGHNAHGAKVRLSWPTGEPTTLWVVQCNLGRGEGPASFTANLNRVKKAFAGRALIGLDEIDEYDRPDEHQLTRELFPAKDGYEIAGWGTYVPTIVPPQLNLVRVKITHACDGLAHVTPNRDLVESVLAPN